MKIMLDRAVDTASGRKSRNPGRAEGFGAVSCVVRLSRITTDMLLTLFVLTPQLLSARLTQNFQTGSKRPGRPS